jgi:cystathionine beta-lyase
MQQANRRSFIRNAGLAAFMGGTALADDIGPNAKFDFDTPYNRLGTDCSKWDAVMKTYNMSRIVAGMGIADVDFKNAPCITNALMKRVQHENWGYLTTPDSFLKGVIAWNKRRYSLEIPEDKIGITTGVHPGIVAALRAFSPPGSKVLMMTPAYDGFYGDLTYLNLRPEENLMKFGNGRFSIDFEDLEKRISHETNTLILCNPQNPTGNCWSREDLTRVGELCLRRRVIVLADEIHCDFVTKGEKYTPFATLENRAIVNNSITFKAASKSFGLAAMKCAWFFSTNRDLFEATRAQNKADLTTLGMLASQAAYAEGEPYLNQLVDYLDGNHDFVQQFFRTKMPPLMKVGAKPQGTYLVWVDVGGLSAKIGAKQMAAERNKTLPARTKPVTAELMVAQWLATNAGVVLNPGPNYGLGGENHMRMNIGTSRKTLEAALNAMADAVKKA